MASSLLPSFASTLQGKSAIVIVSLSSIAAYKYYSARQLAAAAASSSSSSTSVSVVKVSANKKGRVSIESVDTLSSDKKKGKVAVNRQFFEVKSNKESNKYI